MCDSSWERGGSNGREAALQAEGQEVLQAAAPCIPREVYGAAGCLEEPGELLSVRTVLEWYLKGGHCVTELCWGELGKLQHVGSVQERQHPGRGTTFSSGKD